MENMSPAEKLLYNAENDRSDMTPTQIGQIFILAAELSEPGSFEENFTEFVRLYQTRERAQAHIEHLMDIYDDEHNTHSQNAEFDAQANNDSSELYESIRNNFKRFIK
jgi:hypothetical protein